MKKIVKSKKDNYVLKELDEKQVKKMNSGGICIFILRCLGLKYWSPPSNIY